MRLRFLTVGVLAATAPDCETLGRGVSAARGVGMQQSIEVADGQVHGGTGVHVAVAHLIQDVRAQGDVHFAVTWGFTTAAALKLPAVNYASIMLVGQRTVIRTLASSDGYCRHLNMLQQRYREGPGLDAACERQARRV